MATTSKLADLLTDPAKLSALSPEAIAALRGELAKLDTLLLRRLLCCGNAHIEPEGDRLLDVKQASVTLGVTEDWLYRHAAKLPFTVRMGTKQLRFSEARIDRYIRQRAGR